MPRPPPPDMCSLTDFQQDSRAHVQRLSSTGRPLHLTVDGVVGAVVLAPDAYLKRTDLAHEAELIRSLRDALAQAGRGDTAQLAVFDKWFRGERGSSN